MNDLEYELSKVKDLISTTKDNLEALKSKALELDSAIKSNKAKSMKETLTPIVMEAFKLEPKANFAFIKNDGRILFSEVRPTWDLVFKKWDLSKEGSTVKFGYSDGHNNLMAIGIDTTMIEPQHRHHFLWSRFEVVKTDSDFEIFENFIKSKVSEYDSEYWTDQYNSYIKMNKAPSFHNIHTFTLEFFRDRK